MSGQLAEMLFDRINPTAPWFFNGAFLVGVWALMVGGFYLFEKLTRSFRRRLAKDPEGNFLINEMHVAPIVFEIAVNQLARIGRIFAIVGLTLILVAVVGATWRQ